VVLIYNCCEFQAQKKFRLTSGFREFFAKQNLGVRRVSDWNLLVLVRSCIIEATRHIYKLVCIIEGYGANVSRTD